MLRQKAQIADLRPDKPKELLVYGWKDIGETFFPTKSVHTVSKMSKDAIDEVMEQWLVVPVICRVGVERKDDGRVLINLFSLQKIMDTGASSSNAQ